MHDHPTRAYHLPRLARQHYQADAAVHWTLTIRGRATGWLSERSHARWRELLLHCAARERLLCPAYCLMPDHIHLVWMGVHLESDQLNGMAFLRTHFAPELAPARFQPQAHDHVLRQQERGGRALDVAISYDLANPVRKGLIHSPEAWPYHGCIVPGYPKIHPLEDRFGDLFWKFYFQMRDPRCDTRVVPPLP